MGKEHALALQAKDSKAEAKHRNHSKACAIVYPTQVRQGLGGYGPSPVRKRWRKAK